MSRVQVIDTGVYFRSSLSVTLTENQLVYSLTEGIFRTGLIDSGFTSPTKEYISLTEGTDTYFV